MIFGRIQQLRCKAFWGVYAPQSQTGVSSLS